jgi:quercetin dioxygenase-like cupin family protein
MPFIETDQLGVKEPRPGWLGRFFHSDHMTFAYYEIQAGAAVHLHQHPNEEVWHVIDGEVEMTVGDEMRVVHAGGAVVVPADVRHSAKAGRLSHVIVDDFPVRDEVAGQDIRWLWELTVDS